MKRSLLVFLLAAVRVWAGPVQPSPPAGSYSNSVSFHFASNHYEFRYEGADGTLKYTYDPGVNGSFNPLQCTVNGSLTFRPSNVGGLSLWTGTTEVYPWSAGVTFQLLGTQMVSNNALEARWRMSSGTNSLTYLYRFRIDGRTLVIDTATESGTARGVYLDRCENATSPVIVRVPYLPLMNVLYSGGAFCSMFFDWEQTSCSTMDRLDSVYSASSVYYAQYAFYEPQTNGIRRSVNETIYLTVSPSLSDVLPNVPNPVSPYKAESAKRLVYDSWQNPFSLVNFQVDSMRTAGVSNLWVIVHQWQNAGYDNEYPDVLPARAAWGGNAGLQALGQTIRDAGYLFSLHENYVDFYTNAPSWNVNDVSRNSDGSLRPGWYNSFTGVQSYQMKPSRYASYLTNFAAQIHNTFTTTASYLDVHSAVNPTYWVDFDSAVTNAGMFVETLQRNRALAGLLRDIHQGPVSGEGNCHFLTVGYYDDIEAQINSGGGYNVPKTQGQWLPLLVDFELLKLHDKACTHGVGYYERFFADETNTPKFLQYQKDAVLQYIATELAYGHGGFIPTGDRVYFLNEVALLEQRHVLPAQQLYAFARPVSILYGDTNDEVTASTYISRYPTTYANISNANFMAQVRVTYDNGAVVCVNRHPSRQWQVQLGHPGGTFNFHAVLNGSNTLGVVKTNLTSYLLPVRNGWVVFAPDWTPPVISSATVTSGIISLNVTNLLPGCSNRVERCLSLESNTWQTVDTFLSSDVQTNWSHPVSNDWTRAFYRVVRFW